MNPSSAHVHTDFVFDALEQAPYGRQPTQTDALVRHRAEGGGVMAQAGVPFPAHLPRGERLRRLPEGRRRHRRSAGVDAYVACRAE